VRHLVRGFDGPFLCNGSRDGVWTYDERQATCAECLRAALSASEARAAALEAERDEARGAFAAMSEQWRDLTAAHDAMRQREGDRIVLHHDDLQQIAAARALARRRGEALRGLMEEWSRRARALDTWRCTSNEAASEALRACVLDVERALSDERESSGESEGGGEP
jgi:hypothetical protein